MIVKNLKEDKYIMCSWCGKTFMKNSDFSREFSEHQSQNKNCKEYFEIEIVRKGIPNRVN